MEETKSSRFTLCPLCALWFFTKIHRKFYVDADDIIYAGVDDDRICPNNNKIKRRCLPDP